MPAGSDIKIGLGLLLFNERGEILLSRRHDPNGRGMYGGPGGRLEHGESIEQAMRRELAEECGQDIEITNLRMLCVINYLDDRPNHWVGIGFAAELVAGVPQNLEPQKHDDWQWYGLDRLPDPVYGPIVQYIQSYKTGQILLDAALTY